MRKCKRAQLVALPRSPFPPLSGPLCRKMLGHIQRGSCSHPRWLLSVSPIEYLNSHGKVFCSCQLEISSAMQICIQQAFVKVYCVYAKLFTDPLLRLWLHFQKAFKYSMDGERAALSVREGVNHQHGALFRTFVFLK